LEASRRLPIGSIAMMRDAVSAEHADVVLYVDADGAVRIDLPQRLLAVAA